MYGDRTYNLQRLGGTPPVIVGAGELDVAAVTEIERLVSPLLPGPVVLDLAGVTFVDVSVLNCLLRLRGVGELQVRHLPSSLVRILEVTGETL